jgi:membrane fusion protein (multidrug efflux system)
MRKVGRSAKFLVAVLVPVVLILAGLVYYVHGSRYPGTDNAYVKADMVSISPRVSGQIVEVGVAENQLVEKGDVLFRIDDEPYRFALQRLEAKLAKTVTEYGALKARYRQKREEHQGADLETAYFERELQRQQNLLKTRTVSEAKVDESRHNYDNARQKAAQLAEELEEIVMELEGDSDTPLESYSPYREVLADMKQAKLDLQHTVVTAPADGVVAKTDSLQVGSYAFTGAPMLSLIKTEHMWVEANLKETDLTHVRVGQPATVEIDSFPGRDWKMIVASIAPATGAEFAILPPQNATGNWVKVIQRIPVRLEFEDPADGGMLRAGMSVTISIDSGAYHALPDFLQAHAGKLSDNPESRHGE